jgi:hypothetical protein
MWSVLSLSRLPSTARRIHRGEAPRWSGPSFMGSPNFVASTTSSRRPGSALPTMTSDSPSE